MYGPAHPYGSGGMMRGGRRGGSVPHAYGGGGSGRGGGHSHSMPPAGYPTTSGAGAGPTGYAPGVVTSSSGFARAPPPAHGPAPVAYAGYLPSGYMWQGPPDASHDSGGWQAHSGWSQESIAASAAGTGGAALASPSAPSSALTARTAGSAFALPSPMGTPGSFTPGPLSIRSHPHGGPAPHGAHPSSGSSAGGFPHGGDGGATHPQPAPHGSAFAAAHAGLASWSGGGSSGGVGVAASSSSSGSGMTPPMAPTRRLGTAPAPTVPAMQTAALGGAVRATLRGALTTATDGSPTPTARTGSSMGGSGSSRSLIPTSSAASMSSSTGSPGGGLSAGMMAGPASLPFGGGTGRPDTPASAASQLGGHSASSERGGFVGAVGLSAHSDAFDGGSASAMFAATAWEGVHMAALHSGGGAGVMLALQPSGMAPTDADAGAIGWTVTPREVALTPLAHLPAGDASHSASKLVESADASAEGGAGAPVAGSSAASFAAFMRSSGIDVAHLTAATASATAVASAPHAGSGGDSSALGGMAMAPFPGGTMDGHATMPYWTPAGAAAWAPPGAIAGGHGGAAEAHRKHLDALAQMHAQTSPGGVFAGPGVSPGAVRLSSVAAVWPADGDAGMSGYSNAGPSPLG